MQRDLHGSVISSSQSPQGRKVTVRIISPDTLDAPLLNAWRRLSESALEPNAYLTPMFVLPALKHMGSSLPTHIFLMETAGGELIGLGVFTTRQLLPLLPWQSLVGFCSRHTYLTGLLVDREQAATAVEAFFAFVGRPETRWHGVRFDSLNADNALGALLLETARGQNIWWSESERIRRAVLHPGDDSESHLTSRISRSRLKELRRALRRLGETGNLEWRIHSGNDVSDAVIERFLTLEHMGWKEKAGTSLRSSSAQEKFFTSMIAGFRESGDVFFTELLHDGRVIASTCNLISGNRGFAFKIGWDPEFARYSPGILNELCMLERARELLGHLDVIDSGALEGSFIDKLWLDRQELVGGVFATTLTGKLIFTLAVVKRSVRHLGTKLQRLICKALRPEVSSPSPQKKTLTTPSRNPQELDAP